MDEKTKLEFSQVENSSLFKTMLFYEDIITSIKEKIKNLDKNEQVDTLDLITLDAITENSKYIYNKTLELCYANKALPKTFVMVMECCYGNITSLKKQIDKIIKNR